jgi:ABC-2 type transport system permease protein
MLSATRLLAMARKESIQLRRDPRSLMLAFAVPLFLLVFFGYAISFDVRDIRLAVLDDDGSRASRALVEAFEASGHFRVTEQLSRYAEAEGQLERGAVTAVLVIPPAFSRDLAAGRGAPVQFLLDGGDANTATVALSYADAIVARYSREILLRGRSMAPPAAAESRIWYNPTLESQKMVVPGLIAVIMSIIAAMLTALTIAREWERGTMEQLAATPVHRLEVIFGKLLPYLVIGLVDVALATVVGVTLFGVPLHGSLLLLGGMTILFLLGALGLGIFISAALRSQVLATQVAMVATYLPALLLSGFIFDIASMPRALQLFTYIIPARYYVTVTRGIFLKGVGIEVLWVQGLSMILFAAVGVGLATLAFRKRIAP